MPRPSPEIVSYNWPGTFSQYGYAPTANNLPSTSPMARLFDREYASVKTPGYPDVRPLPFHDHWMALRVRKKPATVKARAYLNQYNWYEYNAPVASFGTSFHGPVKDIFGSSVFANRAERLARARCIANIQRLKVNVAQNMAEYRQVSRMFGTNVTRITNAYRMLRKGDVKGFSRAIPLRKRHEQSLLRRGPGDIRGNAPRIWLESQYGWLPLLGDIHTGITNFHSRVEEGYPIRAKASGTGISASPRTLRTTQGITRTYETTTTRERCQYIIEYEVDFSRLANMQSWGLTNPLLLAWELLPYSFVVDWFYPVGDWLSQVGYQLGLYFKRGMRSGVSQRIYIEDYKAIPNGSGWTYSVSGESDWVQDTYFRREVLYSFPSPGKPVVDRDGLRGKRILNALSLLAVAFDRKPRR